MERFRKFIGPGAPLLVALVIWVAKIAAHESDPLKVILAALYPPENSFGGTAVHLRPITAAKGIAPTSLLLIEHEKAGLQDLDVLSADVRADEQVAAGMSGKTTPRMLPGNDMAIGSSIILKAALPPRTLLGVVVSETGHQESIRQRFSYRAGDTLKTFSEEGELIVRTRNGHADSLFFLVGFAALGGWCAGHALARMPRLTFEGDQPKSSRE